MNKYKRPPTRPEEALKRERRRACWRRWKAKHAAGPIQKYGWTVMYAQLKTGWTWRAKKDVNGAVLTNGPFHTLGQAKIDFYKAVG